VGVQYWADGYAACLLVLLVLVFVGGALARFIPPRFPVPRAMVAGLLGLGLGPSLLDVLPLRVEQLETIVYHGLALVFITVSLQTPRRDEGKRSGDVLTIGLGIPAITAMQGVVGMGLVLGWNAMGGEELHPGFGLMAPLGFSQGPGQALAMGAAWTEFGMRDGAAIGLLVAGAGFIWCTIFGSIWLGARRDLLPDPVDDAASPSADASASVDPGAIMRNVMAVALIYFGTWLLLRSADLFIAEMPQLRAMVWGFHFLIGLGLAMSVRLILPRVTDARPLDNPTLGALAGIIVEFTTAAALTALSAQVFASWWLPILLLVGFAGGVTMLICRVLEKFVFKTFPFEHAILLFGTATGTLLTGMALLRTIDPRLETPVASHQVLASALAVPFAAPMLLFVMPYAVSTWRPGVATAAGVTLGILFAYAVVVGGVIYWNSRRTS